MHKSKTKNFLYSYLSNYIMPLKLKHEMAQKNAKGIFILAASLILVGFFQIYQIYGMKFYQETVTQLRFAQIYGLLMVVWGIAAILIIIAALKRYKKHHNMHLLNAAVNITFVIGVSINLLNFFFDLPLSATVAWCVAFLMSLGILTVSPVIMLSVLTLNVFFIFIFGFYDESYINLFIYYIATCIIAVTKWKNCIKSYENSEKINLILKEQDEKILQIQTQIIAAFANLVENRDTFTGEHIRRTSMYVDLLSIQLAEDGYYPEILTPQNIALFVSAAPLHDMGKIVISDTILNKNGKLNSEEYNNMKSHAEKGYEIIKKTLKNIERDEYVEIAAQMALCHHERYDGAGYPQGLKGNEIPLCARIMSVADVYDALLSRRQYKEPLTKQQALEIMKKASGTQFEPCIIEALIKIQDRIA